MGLHCSQSQSSKRKAQRPALPHQFALVVAVPVADPESNAAAVDSQQKNTPIQSSPTPKLGETCDIEEQPQPSATASEKTVSSPLQTNYLVPAPPKQQHRAPQSPCFEETLKPLIHQTKSTGHVSFRYHVHVRRCFERAGMTTLAHEIQFHFRGNTYHPDLIFQCPMDDEGKFVYLHVEIKVNKKQAREKLRQQCTRAQRLLRNEPSRRCFVGLLCSRNGGIELDVCIGDCRDVVRSRVRAALLNPIGC